MTKTLSGLTYVSDVTANSVAASNVTATTASINNATITSTANSLSQTTGALVVSGGIWVAKDIHAFDIFCNEIFFAGAYNSCSQPVAFSITSTTPASMFSGTTIILGDGSMSGSGNTLTFNYNLSISGWYELGVTFLYQSPSTVTLSFNIVRDGISEVALNLNRPSVSGLYQTFAWYRARNLTAGDHTFLPLISIPSSSGTIRQLVVSIKKIFV